jgi:hypothetical protein
MPLTPTLSPLKSGEKTSTIKDLTDKVRRMALEGLGYEDAWVRHKVPLAWRDWVRDIVIYGGKK